MKMIFGVGIALLINSVIVTAICPDPGPNCNCSSLGAEWITVTDNCSEGGCMMKFDGPNTTFEEALDACKEKIALGSHLMTWHSISCFYDLEQWLICENNADPDHTVQWWTAGGEEIPNAVKKGHNGKKWIDIVFADGTIENVIVKIEGSGNGQVLKYSIRPPSAKYGYICMAYCDNCGSGPCQNDGNCTNNGTGYTCSCLPGYTGTNCETDINKCEPEPCQHGGTCTENANGYQCDCAPGYTGTDCETAKPSQSVNGICITDNDDMTLTSIATIDACRSECVESPSCHSIEYQSSSLTCVLSNSYSETPSVTFESPCSKSGVTFEQFAAPGVVITLPAVCISGDDYVHTEYVDYGDGPTPLSDCWALCTSQPNCRAVNYDNSYGQCWLFNYGSSVGTLSFCGDDYQYREITPEY